MSTVDGAKSITSATSGTISGHYKKRGSQHEQIETRSLTVYNRMTKFEWDLGKAKLNIRNHRVSFEEAETAILDELSKTILDPDHSFAENRFITFGVSARRRLLVVCYTHRAESIRIISARTATKREREFYEEY